MIAGGRIRAIVSMILAAPAGHRMEDGMARIKLAYIGGGSTRAPGTLASLIDQGANFTGSEVVLIDLDPERLEVTQTLATKLAQAQGVDLRISQTTDRRAGLAGCDAVLTSFRPGGFEARVLDERIPLQF